MDQDDSALMLGQNQYMRPCIGPSIQVSKGESFAAILERYAYSFGKDAGGCKIEPPAILLCRMQNLEPVQNLNEDGPGVSNLKDSFLVHGYVSAFSGFQLLLADDRGIIQSVIEIFFSSWDPLWVKENDNFEAECDRNPTFHILRDRMFPVGDGNHRLFLWMKVCAEIPNQAKYHVRVKAKFLSRDDAEMMEIVAALQAFNS
ncbi:unnamed protein product [Calypogeia fissa]